MEREGLFEFAGPAVLGIDVGSRIVGVCFMQGDGKVVNTWSIRVKGDPLRRLCDIYQAIRSLFAAVDRMLGAGTLHVYVEESMLGGQNFSSGRRGNVAKVAALHGEVRGVVMSLAWAHGWPVHRMYVQSWKAMLEKEERKVKKNAAYVAYWNAKLGLGARSPDEIDAYFIARKGVVGS